MSLSKRIVLFLITNVAVIAVVSVVLSVFNVAPYLDGTGLNYQSLLIFATLFGFSGSIISLLLSKWMAKRAFGITLIQTPSTSQEQLLVHTIQSLATQAGINMPEVGIYQSPEPNAFATGWNKNTALVAVSTGLMESLTEEEIRGVLGHEISHIANGDMVTLALIQGVVNTFVIFFARIVAYAVTSITNSNNEEGGGMGSIAYFVTSIIFEILFGILASIIVMWFSRYREFRADAGSARMLGKQPMISALSKLKTLQDRMIDDRGKAFATMKISDRSSVLGLFSSHPPIEKRIAMLQQ